MLFNIALNYGGRAEIVDAARRAIAAGIAADDLDERQFSEFLYTAGQPDPDLLIRTSGEMRVSNFLLWQIAYAEIWVTDTLWPDFRRARSARSHRRLPEARPPVRRHQAVAGRARRQVTRVLSGAVLLVIAVARRLVRAGRAVSDGRGTARRPRVSRIRRPRARQRAACPDRRADRCGRASPAPRSRARRWRHRWRCPLDVVLLAVVSRDRRYDARRRGAAARDAVASRRPPRCCRCSISAFRSARWSPFANCADRTCCS